MKRLFVAVAALLCAGDLHAQQKIGMPPPSKAKLFGWAGPEAAAAARVKLGDQVPIELDVSVSADDYRGRRLLLSDFTRDRHGGTPWPTLKQEIGDCVSHGWSHALLVTLAVNQVLAGADAPLVSPFQPYIYGTSRVFIGKGEIRGDGDVGAWAGASVKVYGAYPENASGCPKYSGAIARQWGKSGPPKEFVEIGKHSLADVRMITTWDQAVTALATGNAIAVCSDLGFEKIVEKNGRIEGVNKGSWPHCMCFIGFDARQGIEALYCWNSWGDDAHAPAESYERLDGAQPGGFWVLRKDAERMLAQKDSFAVSFTGFKSPPLWERRHKEEEFDAPLEFARFGRPRDRRLPVVPSLHLGL